MSHTMLQIVQVVGAVMLLLAFSLAQFHLLDQRSVAYLVLNALGSAILAVLAYLERQWGFLLLEGVWTIVSVWGLARLGRAGEPEPAPERAGPAG
jgi:hypothetical protein